MAVVGICDGLSRTTAIDTTLGWKIGVVNAPVKRAFYV